MKKIIILLFILYLSDANSSSFNNKFNVGIGKTDNFQFPIIASIKIDTFDVMINQIKKIHNKSKIILEGNHVIVLDIEKEPWIYTLLAINKKQFFSIGTRFKDLAKIYLKKPKLIQYDFGDQSIKLEITELNYN